MPELPEVQTLVNDLNATGLVGSMITSARVYWPRTIATPSVRNFQKGIKAKSIAIIWRRGKFIVMDLTPDNHLLIHLRMSGRLHLVPPRTERSPHEHVIFSFKDADELRFHDTRKFGRVFLVPDLTPVLGRLGLEPLESGFNIAALKASLTTRKRLLKPLLLDQTIIAGLGNIYVDEALWEAGLHPCRRSHTLSAPELNALRRAIPRVLKRGLNNLGTTLGSGKANFYSIARHQGRNQDQLQVFRRTGLPCPRCRHTIERIIVGQRSTHICPKCQIC